MKKKLLKTLDNFGECCIFASLFDIKQDNKTNQKIVTTKKQREKWKQTKETLKQPI